MDLQRSKPLRRVKPISLGRVEDNMSLLSAQLPNAKQLLCIKFKSPRDDYALVRELRSDQGTLVCHRKNCFLLAVIRESFSPASLQMLETFAMVQHPNVADILDIYFHEAQLYIVGEYLDMSLLDLEFDRLTPEEWEVATIVAEVSLRSCSVNILKPPRLLKG